MLQYFFVRVKGTTRLTGLRINPLKTALLYIRLYMHMKTPFNVSSPSDALQASITDPIRPVTQPLLSSSLAPFINQAFTGSLRYQNTE